MKLCGLLAIVLGSSLSGAAQAWGGCVNSPENPTLVLGALGAAAAGLPWLRARLRRRPDDRR